MGASALADQPWQILRLPRWPSTLPYSGFCSSVRRSALTVGGDVADNKPVTTVGMGNNMWDVPLADYSPDFLMASSVPLVSLTINPPLTLPSTRFARPWHTPSA